MKPHVDEIAGTRGLDELKGMLDIESKRCGDVNARPRVRDNIAGGLKTL